MTKFGPKLAFLVGWLVVVARGLYIARHLLIQDIDKVEIWSGDIDALTH